MSKKIIAYAWRSGLIEFGKTLPEGALPIITGEEKSVKEAVSVLADDSRRGLTVPGVAWTENGSEAVDILIGFSQKVHRLYESVSQEFQS